MKRILYVGMDVHKESYTVSVYDIETDKNHYQQKLEPDYKSVMKYLEGTRKRKRRVSHRIAHTLHGRTLNSSRFTTVPTADTAAKAQHNE